MADIEYLEKKHADTIKVDFEDEGHVYTCYSPYLDSPVYSIAWWERRSAEIAARRDDDLRQGAHSKRAKTGETCDGSDMDDAKSCSSANTSTETLSLPEDADEDGDIDIYTQCYQALFPLPPLHANATSVTSIIKPYWSDPDFEMMRRFCLRAKSGVYAKCTTPDQVQQVWDARRDRGTLMHERFEHLANAYQQAQDGKCSPEVFKAFVEKVRRGSRSNDVGAPVDVALFRLIKQRLGITPGKLEFYRTEMRLFHPALHWPGSIDLLLYDHNKQGWVIVDYKRTDPKNKLKVVRSKMTAKTHPKNFAHGAPCMEEMRCTDYNKYGIQLSLYRFILENVYNMKIVGMKIVAVDREIEETTYLDTPNNERSLVGKLETNMTLSRDEVTTAWLDLLEGTSSLAAKRRGARGAFVQNVLERTMDSFIHVVEIPVKQYDRQITFLASERAKHLLQNYRREMPDTLAEDLEQIARAH